MRAKAKKSTGASMDLLSGNTQMTVSTLYAEECSSGSVGRMTKFLEMYAPLTEPLEMAHGLGESMGVVVDNNLHRKDFDAERMAAVQGHLMDGMRAAYSSRLSQPNLIVGAEMELEKWKEVHENGGLPPEDPGGEGESDDKCELPGTAGDQEEEPSDE